MILKSFNDEEYEALRNEAVLVAGGAAGLGTGNLAVALGASMLAAAASPLLYGGLVAGRNLVKKIKNEEEENE